MLLTGRATWEGTTWQLPVKSASPWVCWVWVGAPGGAWAGSFWSAQHYQQYFASSYAFLRRWSTGHLVSALSLYLQYEDGTGKFTYCVDTSKKLKSQRTKFEDTVIAMWPEFVCPANQRPTSTAKKKSPQTFAHLVHFLINLSTMSDNHTILLFWVQNKRTCRMFSLHVIRVSCSVHYLDVLRAQRIIGFLNLNYPQINEVGKPADVDDGHWLA